MTAGSGEAPTLKIVDPRIAELEDQLVIARQHTRSWEAIARAAARIIEIQKLAIRRLRTPSPN